MIFDENKPAFLLINRNGELVDIKSKKDIEEEELINKSDDVIRPANKSRYTNSNLRTTI
jgi:hypothetical protein